MDWITRQLTFTSIDWIEKQVSNNQEECKNHPNETERNKYYTYILNALT
jgi:hypothetical protein